MIRLLYYLPIIKMKKKADLEQLLNSLIEKGWKPRGIPHLRKAYYTTKYVSFSKRTIFGLTFYEKSIRALVSKESGLWQFVCENKLLAKGILDLPDVLWKRDSLACIRTDLRKSCYPHDYEYRLIESALCDEDKLEEFLLNSIKLD